MSRFSPFSASLCAVLLAGAAVTGFATSVSAQDYGDSDPVAYHDPSPPDEIVIYGDRRPAERGDLGAPVENVALSQPVRFDDLDLTTDWGIHALHARIAHTARTLCSRLDVRYPVTTADSPDCYRTAMDEAAPQAIAAIDQANRNGPVYGPAYGNDRRYDNDAPDDDR